MATLPPDPLADGIARFGERLRRGETTSEAVTRAYFERIRRLEPKLGCFDFIDEKWSIAQAKAIDALLASGTDLGPLMGVPVAVKDLIAVDKTPAHAGSKLDVRHIIGAEGTFTKRLKAMGCVVLGKTKTVEFAIGGTGISGARGCPWNPWDSKVHRIPGGSSSGSAAAMAAGLCGFAIGSDTGGSVRTPAAFCGTFGLKTTKGRWPTDGVFPLSRTLDTLGLLTRSADDAAVILAAYEGIAPIAAAPARGIRLGRPKNYFFDEIEDDVRRCVDAGIERLVKAGVTVDDVEVPGAAEIGPRFRAFVAAELVAELGGAEGFAKSKSQIDPTIAKRTETGVALKADHYVTLMREHVALTEKARGWMGGFDGWICPTVPYVAKPITDYDDPASEGTISYAVARTNRLVNLLGQCAVSLPVQQLGTARLPVSLQVICRGGEDTAALAIGRTVESVVGAPPRPDLSGFL
ncbi:MAG: amidase [Rhodospirillales bacterium]|nr:amidase [Rhodospirillales bacterium]